MNLLLKSLAATFVLIILGLAAVFGFLAFVFWEVDGVERGSLTYLVKIPAHIKEFPVFSPCGKVTYGTGFQDGLSPETSTLTYETKRPPGELRKAFDTATRNLGCRLSTEHGKGPDLSAIAICAAPHPDIHLSLGLERAGEGPECRNVTVLFVEKLH